MNPNDLKALVNDKDMVCKENKSVVLTSLDNKHLFVAILSFKVIILFLILCSNQRKIYKSVVISTLDNKQVFVTIL